MFWEERFQNLCGKRCGLVNELRASPVDESVKFHSRILSHYCVRCPGQTRSPRPLLPPQITACPSFRLRTQDAAEAVKTRRSNDPGFTTVLWHIALKKDQQDSRGQRVRTCARMHCNLRRLTADCVCNKVSREDVCWRILRQELKSLSKTVLDSFFFAWFSFVSWRNTKRHRWLPFTNYTSTKGWFSHWVTDCMPIFALST